MQCCVTAVYPNVRPDRRCLVGGRGAPAQYEGGESRHQGREDTGSLEGQAREAAPQGPRRALDGARLREDLLDRSNTSSSVWTNPPYRSVANETFMDKNGFVSKVRYKKPPHREMPAPTRRTNAGKSVIRSRVKHVFADQKSRMGLFIRTVGIKRAEMKIGMANLAYNIRHFIFLEHISAV